MIAERGGGRFYFTQSAQNIPKIFTKETTEVARNALVEEQVGVHVQKRAELLDGVGIETAPPLRGYVSTKPKPLSRRHPGQRSRRADSGALARRPRSGRRLHQRRQESLGGQLGEVARLRQILGAPGALDDAPLDERLGPQLRDERRRRSAARARHRRRRRCGRQIRQRPRHHAAGDRSRAPRRQARGDHAGDRARPLRRRVHARPLRLVPLARHAQVDGQTVAESTGALSLPYSREYLALPPDEPLLARIAAATGGRVSPSPAQFFDAQGEKVTYHRELWPWCLWLAAFLLLADVAARRVRFI